VLNGKFVIDCVTHGFDNRPENCIGGAYAAKVVDNNYDFQQAMMPPEYRLSHDEYYQYMTADMVAWSLFAESDTDVAVYHTLPTWGVFKDLSPISIGLEIRERWPGRMFVYGAVSPLEGTKALEELDQQAAEWDVAGIKLYPIDIIDGQMRAFSMGDERITYPVLEKCRELGIKTVAIHKALPLGTAPLEAFRPEDVDFAARDFPDLDFEIVHGGYAFLDETAFQVARFDNVYINLEATAQLLCRQPMLFARILGTLLFNGAGKRILWGTGASGAGHAAPVLDAFERFSMPESLREGYGFDEVTDEIKADILGLNYARAHDWSVEELAKPIADDEFARIRAEGGAEPWSHVPGRETVSA
jgi:predicted TIM-barrel fold metal-dependent hydrolase